MSGYVPLFESIATGTLYGRWPDIGLWPIVLALSDKHGVLDVTPHYLAGVTGLPVQDVAACMERFCAPDPYSRTKTEGGARLRLIDAHRDWGWVVVNHAKYREKARLMAKDSARTESGQDAERKRRERGGDSPCPPVSPDLPLSNANANTSQNPTARRKRAPSEEPAEFLDLKIAYPSRAGDQGWRKARRGWAARLTEGHTAAEMIAGAKRYADFVRSTGNEGTEYVKQAATFLGPDKHFLLPWDRPPAFNGKHLPPTSARDRQAEEVEWSELERRSRLVGGPVVKRDVYTLTSYRDMVERAEGDARRVRRPAADGPRPVGELLRSVRPARGTA
jgi:hypothetical protein